MTVEYSIDENDYLTFQLFTASRSAVIRKRRFRTKILFPALYIIFGSVMLADQKTEMAIAFFALSIVWYLLYPIRDRRIYRMNYLNYIQKNFKDAFGKKATIRFEKQQIITKDQVGETRFPITDLKEITEISSAVYVQMQNGQTFILPKDKIENSETLTIKLKEIASERDVAYYNLPDWKWR